jgi:hypothetical protein
MVVAAGWTIVGPTAGVTGPSTGRRVTTVPLGVCVTTVSTGSVVMERVITDWALAPLAASATATARLEAVRLGKNFAVMNASIC